VLINHDAQCGFNDLLAVLTGNFYATDGTAHPIYRQYSQGRIKDEKNRIDLFIWLDDYNRSAFYSARLTKSIIDRCVGFLASILMK
jgi:hypothetical protein